MTDAKKPTPEDDRRERHRVWLLGEIRKRTVNEKGVGCFLCSWILEDLAHGNGTRLTGYPTDYIGGQIFPRAGKIEHLRLEGFVFPS